MSVALTVEVKGLREAVDQLTAALAEHQRRIELLEKLLAELTRARKGGRSDG